jgi:hypothetical protein
MPRRPRVFVEGGIYHVYNRFARGAELLAEPEEAIELITGDRALGDDCETHGGIGRPVIRSGESLDKPWRRAAAGVEGLQ